MKITILGAGAMGAALTVPLTDRGHRVSLWCTDLDHKIHCALKAKEPHPDLQAYLPDQVRLFHSGQLGEALTDAHLLVFGVSTPGVLPVVDEAKPYLRADTPILIAAKGFLSCHGSTEPVPRAVQRYLQKPGDGAAPPILSLAGPSIAGELVNRRPTAAAIAGDDYGEVHALCQKMETGYFWLDGIPDPPGLGICLAYKNIYSIALAWAEGLSNSPSGGDARNLAAILLLQAIEELRKLIRMGQGNPDTANGWAGVGDLAATAGGGRNGSFGRLLASGKSPKEAAATLKDEGIGTIEGWSAAPAGIDYAARTFGSDWATHLPLLRAIGQVLEGQKTVKEVVGQIHQLRKGASDPWREPAPAL